MAEPAIHRGRRPRGGVALAATTGSGRMIVSMTSRRQPRRAATPRDGRAN